MATESIETQNILPTTTPLFHRGCVVVVGDSMFSHDCNDDTTTRQRQGVVGDYFLKGLPRFGGCINTDANCLSSMRVLSFPLLEGLDPSMFNNPCSHHSARVRRGMWCFSEAS